MAAPSSSPSHLPSCVPARPSASRTPCTTPSLLSSGPFHLLLSVSVLQPQCHCSPCFIQFSNSNICLSWKTPARALHRLADEFQEDNCMLALVSKLLCPHSMSWECSYFFFSLAWVFIFPFLLTFCLKYLYIHKKPQNSFRVPCSVDPVVIFGTRVQFQKQETGVGTMCGYNVLMSCPVITRVHVCHHAAIKTPSTAPAVQSLPCAAPLSSHPPSSPPASLPAATALRSICRSVLSRTLCQWHHRYVSFGAGFLLTVVP